MKHSTFLLLLPAVFLAGCLEDKSHRIVLQFSAVKPPGFDQIELGKIYYNHLRLPVRCDHSNPWGASWVHLNPVQAGPAEASAITTTYQRAFEQWEYITLKVDGETSYCPRSSDTIEVGTLRRPPGEIELTAPLKKPLYFLLRTDGRLNRPGYWVVQKGVIQVEEPELRLVLDRKELRRVPIER